MYPIFVQFFEILPKKMSFSLRCPSCTKALKYLFSPKRSPIFCNFSPSSLDGAFSLKENKSHITCRRFRDLSVFMKIDVVPRYRLLLGSFKSCNSIQKIFSF